MKMLSKGGCSCYFIRNDLEQAIEVKRNISTIERKIFADEFFQIYAECVANPNANIIMMSVKEQMELLRMFLQKHNFNIKDVLSLDKFNHIREYWLFVSRIFIMQNKKIEKLNGLYIDGIEAIKAGNHRDKQKILLVDDDICSGQTVTQIINALDTHELFPNADIHTLGLANLCCENYNMIDCIDLRDFVPNTLYGGLVVQIGCALERVCYLDDNIDLYKQASIHPNKIVFFTQEVKKLLKSLFKIGV